jgi:nucleoside-diphosphate-sugar epimerase
VDVKDVVKAMIFLMDSEISGERYILSAENRSYHEIFDRMADVLQKPRPSVKANAFLSNIAWRLEKIRTALTGKDPVITKETARTAQLKCFYENKKILTLMPDLFTPVDTTIEKTGKLYREENPQ